MYSRACPCRPHTTALALTLLGALTAREAEADWGTATKSGRILLNAKGGPSCYLNGALVGVFEAELGIAVDPRHSAYLTARFQYLSHATANENETALLGTIGFQYDFAIPKVAGLFIYPQVSSGYGAVLWETGVLAGQWAVFMPKLGIKYVLKRWVNFGLEPLSIPIAFNSAGYGFGAYQALFYVGLNF